MKFVVVFSTFRKGGSLRNRYLGFEYMSNPAKHPQNKRGQPGTPGKIF